MSESHTDIEGWCIIELFGHNKIAGYVTTAIIGTSGMLRVDVPEVDGAPAYTRFYGPGAVYSLTLVTEDLAKAALREIRPAAVTVYIPRQLPRGRSDAEDVYEDPAYDVDVLPRLQSRDSSESVSTSSPLTR
jgi:hypothetical protein